MIVKFVLRRISTARSILFQGAHARAQEGGKPVGGHLFQEIEPGDFGGADLDHLDAQVAHGACAGDVEDGGEEDDAQLVGEFEEFGPAVAVDFQGFLVLAVGASEGVRRLVGRSYCSLVRHSLGWRFWPLTASAPTRLASAIIFLNSSIEP